MKSEHICLCSFIYSNRNSYKKCLGYKPSLRWLMYYTSILKQVFYCLLSLIIDHCVSNFKVKQQCEWLIKYFIIVSVLSRAAHRHAWVKTSVDKHALCITYERDSVFSHDSLGSFIRFICLFCVWFSHQEFNTYCKNMNCAFKANLGKACH